jgi:hypothetical protein
MARVPLRKPVSWVPLGGELQRDWARAETADAVVGILRREPVPTV